MLEPWAEISQRLRRYSNCLTTVTEGLERRINGAEVGGFEKEFSR